MTLNDEKKKSLTRSYCLLSNVPMANVCASQLIDFLPQIRLEGNNMLRLNASNHEKSPGDLGGRTLHSRTVSENISILDIGGVFLLWLARIFKHPFFKANREKFYFIPQICNETKINSLLIF